jgi:mannose/cellobiose epimerase-like protein (N-acyl-D-glucosamine 2-epimerase family)
VLGEDALQAEWWAVAQRRFIDPGDGSWQHELDPSDRPASTVWDGKPDVYHALQATLIPRFPIAPSLAASLRAAR